MKILFTPGHGLAVHIDGQLAGIITKPGASISPDTEGFYDCTESLEKLIIERYKVTYPGLTEGVDKLVGKIKYKLSRINTKKPLGYNVWHDAKIYLYPGFSPMGCIRIHYSPVKIY